MYELDYVHLKVRVLIVIQLNIRDILTLRGFIFARINFRGFRGFAKLNPREKSKIWPSVKLNPLEKF